MKTAMVFKKYDKTCNLIGSLYSNLIEQAIPSTRVEKKELISSKIDLLERSEKPEIYKCPIDHNDHKNFTFVTSYYRGSLTCIVELYHAVDLKDRKVYKLAEYDLDNVEDYIRLYQEIYDHLKTYNDIFESRLFASVCSYWDLTKEPLTKTLEANWNHFPDLHYATLSQPERGEDENIIYTTNVNRYNISKEGIFNWKSLKLKYDFVKQSTDPTKDKIDVDETYYELRATSIVK